MINRRSILHGMGGTLAAPLAARVLAAEEAQRGAESDALSPVGGDGTASGDRIDRHALVCRHDVHRTTNDPELPIQVGNGRFAFGADITGLQTFAPFATMSDWGWHSDALPPGKQIEDYRGTIWDTYGRPVYYWTGDADQPELHHWLRENPHRINLGRIGLTLITAEGTQAVASDLAETRQHLELWTGRLYSRFVFDGQPVEVETACHPETDTVAVRVTSPLVRQGRLALFLDFPYATAAGQDKFSAPYVGFWDRPADHVTELTRRGGRRATLTHRMDETTYQVGLAWRGPSRIERDTERAHRYHLVGGRADTVAASFLFTPGDRPAAPPASVETVERDSAHWWPRFWRSGGAVELSGSTDPRWRELERRVVLSQYHLAVNEAGTEPPQESGLVNNGWYGKFHLEMYWWHAAHYALWNRWSLLDRSTDIYRRLLPSARDRAAEQGFAGARWPKMTTVQGRESPNIPTALLLWQQPHALFLAELDYRAHPERETLVRWQEVLFATADFMASFAHRDSDGRYVLGPPVMTANERNDSATTSNPAFELSYWRFGLRVAQQWRERLGLPRDAHWDEVLTHLAPLPVQDGVYVLYEGVENMWTEHNTNHPDPIAPYGMLPGDGVDVETMRATAAQVYRSWPVDDLYSWDFPLLAMNAARLGDPARAVDYLLHERFGFTDSGLPASGRSGVPSPYFPGAGGLLYAIAMLCAGWTDGPTDAAPGFPSDGGWTVRFEGLAPAL